MKKSLIAIAIVALLNGIPLTGRIAVHAQTQPDNAASSNPLFPCDGVTLGITTVNELAKLGTRSINISSTNEPYTYYIIKGQKVWYNRNSGLAIFYSISKNDALPEKWLALGMSFEKSYDQWIDFAKTHNMDVLVFKEPQVVTYQYYNTFTAGLWLLYTADGVSYRIQLDFRNSSAPTTTTTDKNTLHSIEVRAQ